MKYQNYMHTLQDNMAEEDPNLMEKNWKLVTQPEVKIIPVIPRIG